jgi:hypothetical protein
LSVVTTTRKAAPWKKTVKTSRVMSMTVLGASIEREDEGRMSWRMVVEKEVKVRIVETIVRAQ